jgi:hypothetical protein
MAERQRESAWVTLDAAELAPPAPVGVLHHERVRGKSALSFEYEPGWLPSGGAFMLDPRLELYDGPQHPVTGQFRIFLDSAPDRWGRLGWRLAPAFDVNPAPEIGEHALAIDERQTRPDVELALATADLYRLSAAAAERIVRQIGRIVKTWAERARALDLPKAEIALMAPAFEAAG